MKSNYLMAAFLVAGAVLAACGGGISADEFEAVKSQLQEEQARVGELEAQVQGLESQTQTALSQAAELRERLDRAAAIKELLDTIFRRPPRADVVLELATLIRASDQPELQAKLVEVVQAFLNTAGGTVLEALGELATAAQQSGNSALQQKLADVASAALMGEAGTAFVEFGALVQASNEPAVERGCGQCPSEASGGRRNPRHGV